MGEGAEAVSITMDSNMMMVIIAVSFFTFVAVCVYIGHRR